MSVSVNAVHLRARLVATIVLVGLAVLLPPLAMAIVTVGQYTSTC
jgi:hypothetical protein